jgi:hypothetical protein
MNMISISAGAIVWASVGILASAAVGVTVGLTGAVTRPTVVDASGAAIVALAIAEASNCAGGPVVTSFPAGTRVLAVEVSADGEWIGVRNPAVATQTVWMRQNTVVRDDEGTGELPVGGECPIITTVQNAPTDSAPPPATTTPTPTVPTPTTPTVDSTKPALAGATASPAPIACYGAPFSTTTTLLVSASDDIGVTAVDVSWSGAYSGQGSMTLTGSTWTYLFDVSTGVTQGNVTFTMTARDAAGNRSSPATVTVFVDCVV